MVEIVGVVPIKLGSVRVQNKNIRTLVNAPLVTEALVKLQEITSLSKIYCFCSSPEIQNYLPSGVVWFPRPEALDSQDLTGDQLFKGIADNIQAEHYFILNATAPFITVSTLQKCYDLYQTTRIPTSTVILLQRRIWSKIGMGGFPVNHNGKTCPKSQEMDSFVGESEGCWVLDHTLLSTGARIPIYPAPANFVELSPLEGLDINTPEDWELATLVAKGMKADV